MLSITKSSKLKRIVAKVLIVCMLVCTNGVQTMAENAIENTLNVTENLTNKDYQLTSNESGDGDEKVKEEGDDKEENKHMSSSSDVDLDDDNREEIGNDIEEEPEDDVSEKKSETATESETEKEETTEQTAETETTTISIASESGVVEEEEQTEQISGDIATESDTNFTASSGLRTLDSEFDELSNTYFGSYNFYKNSNVWNKYQKQLFEFHRIREAWEFIYEKQKIIGNRKAQALIISKDFGTLNSNTKIATDSNGNQVIFKYDSNDDHIIGYSLDNEEELLGTGFSCASIIGSEFNASSSELNSQMNRISISGVASGYNNDLIEMNFALPKASVQCFDNISKYITYFHDTLNKDIDVITIPDISAYTSLYSKSRGSINTDYSDHTTIVCAAGDSAMECDYNLFNNQSIEFNNRYSKAVDNLILVGALQTSYGYNGEKKYDSRDNIYSEPKYLNLEDVDQQGLVINCAGQSWVYDEYYDCHFYNENTNRGDLIDIYACGNNLTEDGNRNSCTSSAAAVVSGVVALMYYVNPNLSAKQVKNVLYKTARLIQEGNEHKAIRVIDAKGAIEEAYKMSQENYNSTADYNEEVLKVYHKKINYIMNDRGNIDVREVTPRYYQQNSIPLASPYFGDCRIKNTSEYHWKIAKVDGMTFEDFNDKHPSMMSIKGDVFYINPNNSDGKEHIVEIGYYDKNDNLMVYNELEVSDPIYNIAFKGKIKEFVTVEIYPNEHISKNRFRIMNYALGANALINPYRMVSSTTGLLDIDLLKKEGKNSEFEGDTGNDDGFAKNLYNYDVIDISVNENENWSHVSNKKGTVLEVNNNSIKVLPQIDNMAKIDYNSFLRFNMGMGIKGITGVKKEKLNCDYLLPYRSGFATPRKESDYNMLSSYNDYTHIGAYKLFEYQDMIVEEDDEFGGRWSEWHKQMLLFKGIFDDISHKTNTKKPNYILWSSRYFKEFENESATSQLLEIPKKNILLSYNDVNGLISGRELVILPDTYNEYYIKTSDKFKITKTIDGSEKIKSLVIDPFEMEYFRDAQAPNNNKIVFKYIAVDKTHISTRPNAEFGYTDNKTKIYDMFVLDRENNAETFKYQNLFGNKYKDMYKYKDIYTTEDFTLASLETLANLCLENHYKYYLYIERGVEHGRTGTELIPIEVDVKKESPIYYKPALKILDRGYDAIDQDVSTDGLGAKLKIKSVKKEKKRWFSCFSCCLKGNDDDEIIEGEGGGKVRVVKLWDVLQEFRVPWHNEYGTLIGAKVKCSHGKYAIMSLEDYLNVEGPSYEIETIRTPDYYECDIDEYNKWENKTLNNISNAARKKAYGEEIVEELMGYIVHIKQDHGGVIPEWGEVLCEDCKDSIKNLNQYGVNAWFINTLQSMRFKDEETIVYNEDEGIVEDLRRMNSNGEDDKATIIHKMKIDDMTESEIEEVEQKFIDIGLDIEKLSKGERDFKKVLEDFVNDILSDNELSLSDIDDYMRVDLKEYIPKTEDLVDKNNVRFEDKRGKEIRECYLDEVEEGISFKYDVPKNMEKGKGDVVEIKEKGGKYLYRYKAEKAGKYSFVTYNNRREVVETGKGVGRIELISIRMEEVDPYVEIYRVKEGKIEKESYKEDDNSLYSNNAIITRELSKGEEIYVRCSVAGEGIGRYEVAVIEDRGKKPIIGDNYPDITLSSGEYYLYNDIRNVRGIVIKPTSDVKIDLNGKKIDVISEEYVFNVIGSKLQLKNGVVINRGSKKGIISLKKLSGLEILDGYYSGEIEDKDNGTGTVGGTITVTVPDIKGAIKIKGGYYTGAKLKEYVGDGVKSKSGTYAYNGETYTYKIVSYRAIRESDFGRTLIEGEYYLDRDVVSANPPILTSGEVNIDLRGKMLRSVWKGGSAIEVRSGRLNIKNGTIVSDYNRDISVSRGAVLNVESGNYYADEDYESVWGQKDGSGRIVIKSGRFSKLPKKYELIKDYEVKDIKEIVGGLKYNVKVVPKLSSIVVKTAPSKIKYKVGEKINPSGLKITLNYVDNTKEEIAYNSNSSKFSFSPSLSTQLAKSNDKVEITYGGKKVSQRIQVIELSSISVKTAQKKNTYYKVDWETFDATGLVINAVYSDNVTKEVIEYNSSTKNEFKFNTYFASGNDKVIVTYKNKSSSIKVKLLEPVKYIKDIKISNNKKESKAKGINYPGYTRIDVDLNKKAGGDYIYLWYTTTTNPEEAIKDIRLSFNESGAQIPNYPGYTRLGTDLNNKAGGDYIYLWYTKTGDRPVRQLLVEEFTSSRGDKSGWNTAKGVRGVKRKKNKVLPIGITGKLASLFTMYTVYEIDSTNYTDLNKNAGGRYIYLRYQY